jgi:hypothetical protein
MSEAVGVTTASKKRRGRRLALQAWRPLVDQVLPERTAIRESSGSGLERVARTLLNKRPGVSGKRGAHRPRRRQVRVDEAAHGLIAEYETK